MIPRISTLNRLLQRWGSVTSRQPGLAIEGCQFHLVPVSHTDTSVGVVYVIHSLSYVNCSSINTCLVASSTCSPLVDWFSDENLAMQWRTRRQWAFYILTFLDFWLSHGSVATYCRWGWNLWGVYTENFLRITWWKKYENRCAFAEKNTVSQNIWFLLGHPLLATGQFICVLYLPYIVYLLFPVIVFYVEFVLIYGIVIGLYTVYH